MRTEDRRTGAIAGVAGGAAGVAAALFVLFGPVVTVTTSGPDGRTRSTVSGIDYLLGNPHAGVELFAWPVLLGFVSVVGALAARRGHRAWTGAAAATLAIFAIVGMASIGLLFAPAAFLMIVAAALLE